MLFCPNGICRSADQAEIRHEINKTFNKAGIEIPFAQRDAHLDTSAGPLDIRLVDKDDNR